MPQAEWTTKPSGEKIKFCCDNCEAPPETSNAESSTRSVDLAPKQRAPMPNRIDAANVHELLQGLDASWPQVGKSRLNMLLRGSTSKTVSRFRTEGNPLFGVLKGASESAVDSWLESLIGAGLLHQGDEDEYFVCRVTRTGREAWQNEEEISIKAPLSVSSRDDLGDEATDALFEALRKWRRSEAESRSLPPYCVVGDKALLEIALRKPTDETELLSISGIGPSKIEQYGAMILDVLWQEKS